MGTAGETVIDLPDKMDREGAVGSRGAAGEWAPTAKLGATARGRLEAQPVQDLTHRDLLPELAVVNARHGCLGG